MNPVPAVCATASVVAASVVSSASASASASTVAAASTSSRMATYASTSLSRTTTLATVGGVITRLNGHHGAYALAHPTPNATAVATALASAGASSSRPTRAANRPRDDDTDDTVAHPSSSSPFAPATRARALVVRRARTARRASPRIHRAPSRARCVVLARIGAVATAMTSRTRTRARRCARSLEHRSRPRARRVLARDDGWNPR